MSKYRIKIEGKVYEMEVELIDEKNDIKPSASIEHREFTDQEKRLTAPAFDQDGKRAYHGDDKRTVTSPMPGTVIKISKSEGDAVREGNLVLVLEAMKMENEILAPADGRISAMNCKPGETVAGGAILFEIQ